MQPHTHYDSYYQKSVGKDVEKLELLCTADRNGCICVSLHQFHIILIILAL